MSSSEACIRRKVFFESSLTWQPERNSSSAASVYSSSELSLLIEATMKVSVGLSLMRLSSFCPEASRAILRNILEPKPVMRMSRSWSR